MTATPYFDDGGVTLYHGDCRDVVPALGGRYAAAIIDPPYGTTRLPWDQWIPELPALVAAVTDSMWWFGTAGVFWARHAELAAPGWRPSHDRIWDKEHGTRPVRDRFIPTHEQALHFYRGPWSGIHHTPGTEPAGQRRGGATIHRAGRGDHVGGYAAATYVNGHTRLKRSVIRAPRVRGGISRTQKPLAVVLDLVEYAVPAGGVVLDPTAASATTGVAAMLLGRRAVLVEGDERQCELAARRLSTPELFMEVSR